MNNLAPMKIVLGGVLGNLNWMPGYKSFVLKKNVLYSPSALSKVISAKYLY